MADEQTTTTQTTDGTKGTDGTNTQQTPSQPPPQGGGETAPAAGEKTLTQTEVNAIIARERKAWEKTQAEERKKAEMTEADRLKAEKAEAEQKAAESAKAANARIVKTEARAALADAGVKPERRDYALRMLDLSGVEVSDGGDVDAKALSGAIDALLKEVPELKGGGSGGAAGAEFGGSGNPADPSNMTMAEYAAWRKTQG